MTAACRSCGAAILWAISEDGKRMPLDAASEPRLVAVGDLADGTPVVKVERTWQSHFASCPQAAEWRRK